VSSGNVTIHQASIKGPKKIVRQITRNRDNGSDRDDATGDMEADNTSNNHREVDNILDIPARDGCRG
jgi:hypothetical protein